MILHRTPLVALLAFPKSNMRQKKRNCGLSCKNRLMYPVVNGISGSLNCIPFSKAQDSGFHKQNWYPWFQNPYSSTRGDKRSHRAKLQMVYCDEKKQNGWKSTKPQCNLQTWPYMLGWLLHKSLIECFWHVRRLAPSPARGLKQADQLQCLYVFLITNVTFSLAYVNIASSLQQQLLLNALKRNFALFKTVFKFLTSPHQNSIKKGRISFVWNSSSKIVFGKKVRLAYIIVYFFCPVKNNGCRLIMFYFSVE